MPDSNKKPYRLLLISQSKPASPDGICGSNRMIAWAVWSEMSKLSHVSLFYQNSIPEGCSAGDWHASITALPQVDFTLIHSCLPCPIFDEMPVIRAKTTRQVMWISELPYHDMDHNFTFLPCDGCEQIPLPALREILNASMVGAQKLPGSILLDHAIPSSPCWAPFYADWTTKFHGWLAPLAGSRVISQQRKEEWEPSDLVFPDWLRLMPNLSYLEYLRLTASYENYVMTHPGTYEHSLVDMAARGIRILVPMENGRPFAPQDTVNRFKLQTFATREEFFALLEEPPLQESWRADICTDIPEMAAVIDAHCQKIMADGGR